MRYQTWMGESAVYLAGLALIVHVQDLPLDARTATWAGGAYIAHSVKSHLGRLAERSGRGVDVAVELAAILGGALTLVHADARQRAMAWPIIVMSIWFLGWRKVYRKKRPHNREWRLGGWS